MIILADIYPIQKRPFFCGCRNIACMLNPFRITQNIILHPDKGYFLSAGNNFPGNIRRNKNISIIAGSNGYGKTTFLNALIWCLYGRLIGEVDEKYKKDISEAGGYKKYAVSILNREIRRNNELPQYFSVEIELSDVQIPSVPCNKINIIRRYNISNESEEAIVLIDGFINELTKEVGTEIFINDFILPREIAKFFFFDAEKIVSLAEVKSLTEKKNLSKAYSEVLGINKYEALRKNLENLSIKLRKKSASLSDRNKLEILQNEARELDKLIEYNNTKIIELKAEIERNRLLSEQYQEKLIREGNSISVEELISLKKVRDKLKEKSVEIKLKLKDLLEIAPFAIAGCKLQDLNSQIKRESHEKQHKTDYKFIEQELVNIKAKLINHIEKQSYPIDIKNDINIYVNDVFKINLDKSEPQSRKTLLDLNEVEQNEFFALYDNIRHSFRILFQQIVKEEKDNRIFLTKTLRKISQAESKDSDLLVKKYKTEKEKIDRNIQLLNHEIHKSYEEIGGLQQGLATKSKIISELAKNVKLDELDSKKDEVIQRLITELTEFIFKFKEDKKQSLENRIKIELHRLMHKDNFIADVDVQISEELIDINLYDKTGQIIEKETLSKGEQQLYATALLKSLVDESEIQFPIFIDSPLQKFDKNHSKNIIEEFYPAISKQLILFPLLEKELTEQEFSMILPNVNQTFTIINIENRSKITECIPTDLFNEIEASGNVYSN